MSSFGVGLFLHNRVYLHNERRCLYQKNNSVFSSAIRITRILVIRNVIWELPAPGRREEGVTMLLENCPLLVEERKK